MYNRLARVSSTAARIEELPQYEVHKFTLVMRFVLAIWLALLTVISLFPVSFKLKLHMTGPLHDDSHYIVFFLTAIFLWLIAERPSGKLFSFLAGLVFLYVQEWAENKIYHAGFEWRDVATDSLGLFTGFSLMFFVTCLAAIRRD